MGLSLYQASIPTYLQVLDAAAGFLGKGLSHCQEHGIDPGVLVDARLFHDMLPFRFQVLSVVHHSEGATRGLLSGGFAPPGDRGTPDYAALQGLVADAAAYLRTVDAAAVDAREGQDVVFRAGGGERVFTAEGFLMSFSLPNLFFHAATAYDILRVQGVAVGKRDYLGALRLKG